MIPSKCGPDSRHWTMECLNQSRKNRTPILLYSLRCGYVRSIGISQAGKLLT
jgi:hypothetical protein